jgi:ribA/ribD-fused uncharacterized protein
MDDDQRVEQLCSRLDAGETLDCFLFWGHRRNSNGITGSCFSQWFASPFEIDGERFLTSEHFMMAEKAALFGDQETRGAILQTLDPGAAKVLGRQVRGFDEPEWTDRRFSIALRANEAKFSQHRDLGRSDEYRLASAC